MKNELKCWPQFFQAMWVGRKTFEIRKNDRNFQELDEVVLQEWNPNELDYTGREIEGFIEYLSIHEQKPGYVVFSIHETGRRE